MTASCPAPSPGLAAPVAAPLPPPVAIPPVVPVAAPEAAAVRDGQRAGVLMICAASLIFAVQDAVSRHLGAIYPPVYVTMLRYWFFAVFAVVLVARSPGGVRAALRSPHPVAQTLRGLILVAEVVLMLTAFVKLGIVETHAVFTILIILQPGLRVFSPWAALPLISALMFAVYALLTRKVSADDSAMVSFFWTGVAGAVGITLAGIWFAVPIARADWPWMAALCLTGAAGHYLLIRAYALAEASSLQPFAYTQLVWVSLIGVFWLGETLRLNVLIGMVIIVGAGLFTWWRTLRRARTG